MIKNCIQNTILKGVYLILVCSIYFSRAIKKFIQFLNSIFYKFERLLKKSVVMKFPK